MLSHIIKLEKIDITIVLRAFSIFAIVSGHFGLIGLAGGAFYLIFLSGYNFVKFTLPKTLQSNEMKKFNSKAFKKNYFNFLIKLITPVLLYLGTIYILLGKPYFAGLFLVSNFYGPEYGEGMTFWFIEVLIQIYLLFYVLTLTNKYYNWLGKYPFISFLVGFFTWLCISLICRHLWDTSEWLDRFPHLMIYMFFLGALIASSSTTKERIISSICVLTVCVDLYFFGLNSRTIFLIIGALLTIWCRIIIIPAILYKPIYAIAMSSLFIYMFHFHSRLLLEKIPFDWPPILTVSFALVSGIILAKIWKNRALFYKHIPYLKREAK